MAISVFVSHSTNETADKPFLHDLHARLSAVRQDGEPVFDVIVDEDELKAGDHWRSKLLDNLGSCRAAVVLLNTKAISESPWVHQEASIFRWRQWLGEELPLVLVLLGNGSSTAFDREHKWEPLAFSELQFLGRRREFSGAVLEDTAFDELVAVLKNARGASANTHFEKLRDGVLARLQQAFAGQNIGTAEVRSQAERLLEEGPGGVLGFIDDYREQLLDADYVESVLELIAPWWVDPVSSCQLAHVADEPQAPVYSFNGYRLDYTPVMYVRNACCGAPDFAWKVVRVTGAAGTQDGRIFHRQIIEEVRAGLKQAYRRVWKDRESEVSDAEINELVASRRRRGRPTFVALNTNIAASREVADAILQNFPYVTLLLMTETQQQARSIRHATALEPLPDPQLIMKEHGNYRDALGEF